MRLDLVLSNWIFLWFILFGFKVIPYNPTFILTLSFVLVFFEIFIIIYYSKKQYDLTKFIVINVFIFKLLPILSLALNNSLSITLQDVYFTIFIMMIYSLYLYVNKINVYDYYKILVDAYITSDIKVEDDNPMYPLYEQSYDYIYSKLVK